MPDSARKNHNAKRKIINTVCRKKEFINADIILQGGFIQPEQIRPIKVN